MTGGACTGGPGPPAPPAASGPAPPAAAAGAGSGGRAAKQLPLTSVLDHEALLRAFEAAGVSAAHVGAIYRHVIRDGRDDLDVDGLPPEAREVLASHFRVFTSRVIDARTSGDGTATKLLLELQDGLRVEAVILRMDASAGKYAGGPRGGGPRATLCVSSQAGCKMACTFCATGALGFRGHLTAGEILEQALHARRAETTIPLRNITFMGQGEPLDNYSSVLAAVRGLCDNRLFGLSRTKITISTVGAQVGALRRLAADEPKVNLALSLHAPNQALRQALLPRAARATPLPALLAALAEVGAVMERPAFIEYILLAGVNDSEAQADELSAVLKAAGLDRVTVNLIPYNATATTGDYRAPTAEAATAFQRRVREGAAGLRCTVRREMGQDIAGACGQLALLAQGPARAAPEEVADIEDFGYRD